MALYGFISTVTKAIASCLESYGLYMASYLGDIGLIIAAFEAWEVDPNVGAEQTLFVI